MREKFHLNVNIQALEMHPTWVPLKNWDGSGTYPNPSKNGHVFPASIDIGISYFRFPHSSHPDPMVSHSRSDLQSSVSSGIQVIKFDKTGIQAGTSRSPSAWPWSRLYHGPGCTRISHHHFPYQVTDHRYVTRGTSFLIYSWNLTAGTHKLCESVTLGITPGVSEGVRPKPTYFYTPDTDSTSTGILELHSFRMDSVQ
jgi:hypothetical protein